VTVLRSLLRLALAAVAVVCATLAFERPARAAMMHHHDLTSLALQADVIVRARQTAERKADTYTTVRSMKVTRSYKGTLTAGAAFDIAYDLYAMEPFGSWGNPPDAGAGPVLGPELIFFLRRAEDRPGQERGAGGGGYWIVPSGLRIFLDGKAQRFEQWSNPGGYVPVPQGHDPFDIFGDPRGGAPLDLAGLEAEIAVAVRRARDVEAALSAPDSPAARRRLVALAGPAPEDAPTSTSLGGFYADVVARRVIEALAKTGDLTTTLEALARSSGVATFGLNAGFDLGRLLSAAEDKKLPTASRVAALRMADGRWYDLRATPSADARVVALFSDKEPEVRAAALAVQTTEKPTEAQKTALLARWKAETDDGVRVALVNAAASRGLRASLARTGPVVSASRARDVVRVTWADPDERVNLMVKEARVVATRAGSPDRTVDFTKAPASYSNGSTGGWVARIAFDPPLSPGDVEIALDVVVEDLNKRQPDVSKHVGLGTMTVTAPAASPPTPSPSAAPSAPATSDAGDAGPPPIRPTRRSACACDLAASHRAAWVLPLSLAFALATMAAARRSRR
jgi:hypothetical protein